MRLASSAAKPAEHDVCTAPILAQRQHREQTATGTTAY